MKVSVLVPCHNARKYVGDAIRSALSQTWRDIEVIVVDDGSTDGSADEAAAFGDAVRVERGPNRGVSAARNRCTELASGECIQYLDADDLLLPDAVEKRLRALEVSGADVAYSDWQTLEEAADGSFRSGQTDSTLIEDVDPDPQIALFTRFSPPPVALLYRRRIVERIGRWRTDLPYIQDARFLLDAAMCGAKFVHVPGVGAEYRITATPSLSRRDPLGFAKDVFLNAKEVEAIWTAGGPLAVERRRALAAVYAFPARVFFERRDPGFGEVMSRIGALEGFRFDYPHVAQALSRFVGRDAARTALRAVVGLRQASQAARWRARA